MATPPEPPPRFVDNRGKKREPAPELNIDPDVAEGLAAQAAAAEQEQSDEPALALTTFILLGVGLDGAVQVHYQQEQIQQIMSGGIATMREATPADIMNISGQLSVMCLSNEVTGRVMGALQQQAMQQVMAKMPARSGLATS